MAQSLAAKDLEIYSIPRLDRTTPIEMEPVNKKSSLF
jgi:hypothetical protein